jgi:hypothetical protein
MKVKISSSIFSVITAPINDHTDTDEVNVESSKRHVGAYLYDHSKIVLTEITNRFVFHIVETTSYTHVETESTDATSVHQTPTDLYGRGAAELIKELFYLANYQLNRLGSAPLGGILAGSYDEARELLAEAAR